MDFVLGPGFTILYDVVKEAMGGEILNFKPLKDLASTLDSFDPQIIKRMAEVNTNLGLSVEEVENLKTQMERGTQLVHKLSKLQTCNIVTRCQYAGKLDTLNRSLQALKTKLMDKGQVTVLEHTLLLIQIQNKRTQLERVVKEMFNLARQSDEILAELAREVPEEAAHTVLMARQKMEQLLAFERQSGTLDVQQESTEVDVVQVDSASSFEVNSVPEKIPASPLRVPPSPRFSKSPKLSRLGSVHHSLSKIAKATHNFSQSQQVGEGGFGTVYKARLEDGQVVSIKRAKKEHFENLETEFSSEVEVLAKIDHRNLVKLLGYVDEGNERLIITDYVPNGTLREHLDGQHGKILEFNQRLEIAIDVAHALTYLHLYAEKQIIHRDVKSSNILLTESMRAKVADFRFARLAVDSDQTRISTKVKGTVGYLDPEYMRTYQVTPKSDVYSFGILLIEIITGRRPVELKRPVEERLTLRWAFKKLNEGRLVELVDPALEEVVDAEVVEKIFDLAIWCAAPIRADRPDMKSVGEQLWTIRADHLRSVKKG